MSTFSWVYKPYTFWDCPPKEYTSTFFECQNPHENNKNQAKVYRNFFDFHRPPPSPWKCMFCILVKMLTFMEGPLIIDLLPLLRHGIYSSKCEQESFIKHHTSALYKQRFLIAYALISHLWTYQLFNISQIFVPHINVIKTL